MLLKIALPKGRLLPETAELLQRAGWGIGDYHEKARSYRLKSARFPAMMVKVFQEKDIPIQVAVGNYDLGICGLDWVEELMVKYPSSAIVKINNLGYGDGAIYTAGRSREIEAKQGITRIAGEYPNLAESFAESLRLKRFSIYPLWGAAEAYPPENADIVLVTAENEKDISGYGLVPIGKVVDIKAFLIANGNSLKSKDMAEMLASITDGLPAGNRRPCTEEATGIRGKDELTRIKVADNNVLRLALPDGHQQSHVKKIFDKAGIEVDDYPSKNGNRRPACSLDGVFIKVIRPQDMPLQIANGNFDLAITGRDWLTEHRYQFPSSPATELLDLKYGRVRIVAVVSNNVPIEGVEGLIKVYSQSEVPCRVASEYVNVADSYARKNHLGRYRVIPTWGASESFLPEDADLLIENTETGGTIARHNLKIIDTLFESTACLIGSNTVIHSPVKTERKEYILKALKIAVEAI
jgi:ATP phosphoribosyltransferase